MTTATATAGLEESYYARLVPLVGTRLRTRRVAVCGTAGVALAAERLAACGGLRPCWPAPRQL